MTYKIREHKSTCVKPRMLCAVILSCQKFDHNHDWTASKQSNRRLEKNNRYKKDSQLTYEERRKDTTKTYEGPEDRLNQGRDETKIF
jgi:hypothetical protein